MSILFQVLASGSKGNAVLVCSPKTRVLVDAGLSGTELVRRLEQAGHSARRLDALIVTHEHQDHVRGVGVLSRRFNLPVYCSRGTLENLPMQIGKLAHTQLFQTGHPYRIGDLLIHPFAVSHDAQDPAGMTIENDDCRLGMCTDLGIVTQLVRQRLQGCRGLLLEANHDPELLMNGPYPWHLKQRIRGRHGHLSNTDTHELLRELFHEGLRAVVLAHLSEINNRPKLVLEALADLRQRDEWEGIDFHIGKQHEIGCALELT
jgi:phosphoribosyl 1,2-cyclic phosphodiesterase